MHYYKLIPAPKLLIRRVAAHKMLDMGVFARLEKAGWIEPIASYNQPDFFSVGQLGAAVRRLDVDRLP